MNWPGEGLLIKLWETLAEKGVGGLLKPWQIKREAVAQLEARRIEIVALADAEREAEEIRSGRLKLGNSRYAMAVPQLGAPEEDDQNRSASNVPSAVEILTAVMIGDALRREVNVAKAVTYAEEELKNDPQKPPEKNVDSDWLFRWRDYAGAVSSEELQSLWGRLLAGELKSPGCYSFRTLDFMRNLSMDEAKKIEKLSQFVVANIISRNQKTFLENEGINFGVLLEMQDLGLLSGVEAIGMSMTYKSNDQASYVRTFVASGRVLVVRHEDPLKEFKLEVYIVTTLGKQVMRLAHAVPHEAYLRAIGQELKKVEAQVVIANYTDVSNGLISVLDEEPI